MIDGMVLVFGILVISVGLSGIFYFSAIGLIVIVKKLLYINYEEKK